MRPLLVVCDRSQRIAKEHGVPPFSRSVLKRQRDQASEATARRGVLIGKNRGRSDPSRRRPQRSVDNSDEDESGTWRLRRREVWRFVPSLKTNFLTAFERSLRNGSSTRLAGTSVSIR